MNRLARLLAGGIAVGAIGATAHAQCPVSFALAVNYAAGAHSRGVAVGDLNSDGRPDIAVGKGGPSSGVFLRLGNPGGTFRSAGSYPVAAGPWSVAVGDFNADGKLDLAVGYSSNVAILLGNGNGTCQTAATFAVGLEFPRGIAVGDFHADGRVDVAAAFINGSWPQNSSVSVLLNTSACYQDCNHDCRLTVADFGCFQTKLVVACP